MIAALPWSARGLDASALLSSCRALQTTRLRLLLMALLSLGAVALLAFIAMQVLLGYPAVRFVALALATLVLLVSLLLVRNDKVQAATGVLMWGVAAAVSAQSMVAGGLHNPGLFAFPAVLAVTGGMLGMRQARWMLGAMLLVLVLLAGPVALGSGEPWGWQPVAPSPPAMRALVLGVFLVLMYVGQRAFMRSHLRDVRAIEALNKGLNETIAQLRDRESALLRAQQEVEAFNQVLDRRVQERTAELATALRRMEGMQQELVQVEKMAALGSLVAGMAHELNTPIGTALICSSTLEANAHDLLALLQRPGALRRVDMVQLAQRGLANAELAQRSLHRAAGLVESFKGVAVDHDAQPRRCFDLAQTVARLADTLRPALTPQGVTLELEVPPGIELDSFPGALDQVLLELVRNACQHAFAPGAGGRIRISASHQGDDGVELQCSDDGRGLLPTELKRIFDPFYTARMGGGGPGLGLAIAFNLAQRVLRGSLTAESMPGLGTSLKLRLPLVA